MFAAAAMTLAVTTLVFHTGVFPRWVGWFGVLATIAGLLGFMVFPTLLILVFILILSIYLLRPERGAPAEAAPPVSP
jgi:uncharacterized membrane protein